MGYSKKMSTIIVVCICLAISALFGIVYASFTQSINISGSATVAESRWKIEFYNLHRESIGANFEELNAPQMSQNATRLDNWRVNIWGTGSIVYSLYVRNSGSFSAELSSISVPNQLTCKDIIAGTTVACSGISVTLTKDNDTPLALNEVLDPGDSVKLKLTLTSSDATFFNTMTHDVMVDNLNIQLTYTQVQ